MNRVPGNAVLFAAGVWAAISAMAADTGTDVVTLVDGGSLRGAVVGRDPDGAVLVAVQRRWLEDRMPRLARKADADESRETPEAWRDVVRRLEARLGEGLEPGLLRRFLEKERERIVERLAAGDEDANRPPDDAVPEEWRFQFSWVRLPQRMVKKVVSAKPEARRVVQWAWHERMDDVETQTAGQLSRRLIDAGVDPSKEPPALGDRLPPRVQGDREWRFRMALVDDLYGEAIAYEGFDETLVRSGRQVGPEALLPLVRGMISSGTRALVDGGAQRTTDDWLADARRQSGSEGRFRARRVRTAAAGPPAVESVFAVRTPDGEWTNVWAEATAVDPARARQEDVLRVGDDPRVRGLIDLVRASGLADEGMVDAAIRTGAATMAAANDLESRFAAFREAFTERLDGPPLVGR